ncbi:MAG: anaerobic sulfatase maturase [bacterium]
MKPFSLLIKPASADCNLRCDYCFYLEKRGVYPDQAIHRMNIQILKRLIKSYLRLDFPQLNFGWQGGEPTLMGLDFFKQAVNLQKQYCGNNQTIGNGLQTNGILINNEWCRFFHENQFLIGLSLDGPREIHDKHRRNKKKESVHDNVMRSVEILQNNYVAFNSLTVINKDNYNKAVEIYDFLRKRGIFFHQYIPAIISTNRKINNSNFSISGMEYGRFLIDLFNRWYPDDIKTVSIRLFDSIINRLTLGTVTQCNMGESCDGYFVVEYNGDVYPCDYYVENNWLLGNIKTNPWQDLCLHEKRTAFAALKMNLNSNCTKCDFLGLCKGDCTRHRDFTHAESGNLSALCSGLKFFYAKTLDKFQDIAGQAKVLLRQEIQ